jgi:hypothetical protein
VDPSRTGGKGMLSYDECGQWCRDLILEKGLGAVILRTPKPGAPTAETLFRRGTGGECVADAPECVVAQPITKYPDEALIIEMGDEEWPDTGSACCPVAVVARVENGRKSVIKTYRQGVHTAILPIPVIASAGTPLPVMTRDVALGPDLRFDTLIEALLDTELRWKP